MYLANELKVSPLKDGKSWKVLDDFVVSLPGNFSIETITVPQDFILDFASVPRLLHSFAAPATGKYRIAAVVHDWLYNKQFTTRKEADDIFLFIMECDEVPWYKRYPMYWAVRTAGWSAWDNNQKELYR